MTTRSRKPRRHVEREETRLPLIDKLIALGWDKDELLYEPEWRVPKTPSDAILIIHQRRSERMK